MYRRIELPLDNVIAKDDKKLVGNISRDVRLKEVFVSQVPGSAIKLYFGADRDDIDIASPISFEPEGEEAKNGLYWSNPVAQAGIKQVVYVVFNDNAGEGSLNVKLERA